MTLAASANKVIYDGDGSNTQFSYSFAIDTTDGSDILVYVVDDELTVTLLTGNYSVDVNNARVNYPTVGGVSPLGASDNALPVGWQIVLVRIEQLSQEVALSDQGAFDADGQESGLDKIMMICQQLQEQINRCVKYPIYETEADSTDVDAFIAAVSAAIMPEILVGTYAYLKSYTALTDSSTKRFGWATDHGNGELYFFTGNTDIGDQGWAGPLT